MIRFLAICLWIGCFITLSGVVAFAQHPAQWLIRKNLLLDFNSSPPDTIQIPDTFFREFNRSLFVEFHYINSDKTGKLSTLGFTRISTIMDETIFLNNDFKVKPFVVNSRKFQRLTTYPDGPDYISAIPKLSLPNNKTVLPVALDSLEDGWQSLSVIHPTDDSVYVNTFDTSSLSSQLATVLNNPGSGFYYVEQLYGVDTNFSPIRVRQYDANEKPVSDFTFIQYNTSPIYPRGIIPANKDNSFILFTWLGMEETNDTLRLMAHCFKPTKDNKLELISEFQIWKNSSIHYWIAPRPLGACFSPNDSMVYVSFCKVGESKGQSLIRKKLYSDSDVEFLKVPDSSYVRHMGLGPDGQIYFMLATSQANDWCNIGCLHFPDKSRSAEIGLEYNILKKRRQIDNWRYYLSDYEPNVNIGQDLLRFKVKQPRCNADYVVTHNYSDSPMIQFTWQLLAMDSTVIQTIDGNAPKLHPPKSGDYFVKLNGRDQYGRNYWRWDKFHYNAPPQTEITPLPTSFCAHQTVKLEAKTLADTGSVNTYSWTIQPENQSPLTLSGKKPEWKPNLTGAYSIRLVYNNGLCTDTAYASFYVKDAPNPGFTLSDDTLCTGMKLTLTDTSIGEISSARYTWSDGQVYGLRAGHERSFDQPGKFKVVQELSFLQCISRDSAIVWVRKGLSADSLTELKVATIPDNHRMEVHWKPTFGIAGYVIKRLEDNTRFFVSGDSMDRFIDSFNIEITQSYSYTVAAMDSCGNFGAPENLGKTVFLSATNPDNQKVVLRWTPYQGWKQGVQAYSVESSSDGINWDIIAGVSDTNYSDFRIPLLADDSLYYRIKAIEQSGNRQFSFSNTALVNTQTKVFIPNAFSPNGDGTNDVFKIGHFGISEFNCSIFARTGQLVAYSEDPENIWNGKSPRNEPFSPGSYTYVMKMIDHRGVEYRYSGYVVVIWSNQ